MADWRVAKSLDVLRTQINQAFPGRDKSSDGTIGDTRHQQEKSEHNPDPDGTVRAMDISNDPAHGVVSESIAHQLIDSRDRRILYVISRGKICSSQTSPWVWRERNKGAEDHTHHFHISVLRGPHDSTELWKLNLEAPAGTPVIPPPSKRHPTIRRGTSGADVSYLQRMLGQPDTGTFDSRTEQAVIDFQRKYSLVPDGIVGPYTWEMIEQ